MVKQAIVVWVLCLFILLTTVSSMSQRVLAQAPAAQQPSMLFFSAPWCEYCQGITPVVRKLTAAGFDIREVNIDSEPSVLQQQSGPQLKALYQIDTIPQFIIMKPISATQATELARVKTIPTEAELRSLMRRAGMQPKPAKAS